MRPPPTISHCELRPGRVDSPWQPLILRGIVGVGRSRARKLAQAAWSEGLVVNEPDLLARLQALPGIGPVIAGRVRAWATIQSPDPYTGEPDPAPQSIRIPP